MARATSATGTAICPIWASPKFACGELDMKGPPVISWSGDVQHEIGFEVHGGCVLEMEDTPGGTPAFVDHGPQPGASRLCRSGRAVSWCQTTSQIAPGDLSNRVAR